MHLLGDGIFTKHAYPNLIMEKNQTNLNWGMLYKIARTLQKCQVMKDEAWIEGVIRRHGVQMQHGIWTGSRIGKGH